MKKKIVYLFLLLFLFGFSESKKVVINGYMPLNKDREYTLSIRDKKSDKQIIAKTKSVNGKFIFECEVDKPTYAYIGIPGSEMQVILEPGTISLVSNNKNWPIPSGTYYNDLLNAWRKSDEMKGINQQMSELEVMISTPAYNQQSDSVRRKITSEFASLRSRIVKIEQEYLQTLIGGEDSYAQLFAIVNSRHYGEKEIELLSKLEKTIGNYGEIKYILDIVAERKKQAEQREKIVIGNNFLEISGVNTEGENIVLSEVVANNKYTLLEFWASWCSPCRKEIPHLKESYDLFKNKGFQIFSYSIDSDRKAWLKAEKDESLTWISISGSDEDSIKKVSELYVIQSIPKNILIDSQGKIVALNLRGEALNRYLEDLLK